MSKGQKGGKAMIKIRENASDNRNSVNSCGNSWSNFFFTIGLLPALKSACRSFCKQADVPKLIETEQSIAMV
jgi:hypothetical protein